MSTRAPAVLKNTAEDVALGARDFIGVNFFETSITRIYSLSSLMSENGAHICRDITICRNLLTWKYLGKKVLFFWSETVFLGQEVHYYMVYIAYFTELNSKI